MERQTKQNAKQKARQKMELIMKKVLPVLFAALILATMAASCSKAQQTNNANAGAAGAPKEDEAQGAPGADGAQGAPKEDGGTGTPEADGAQGTPDSDDTYMYTDSAGREVMLPRNIERIAPSGAAAQLVLFTLCPEKLAGFSMAFTDEQFDYIDVKYKTLPVFGSFYSETLNLESVMVANPQVIIDVGEFKPGIADDMDGLQERTGIPAIFIHMDMLTIAAAYETLGEVTGATGQAQEITGYIRKTLSEPEDMLRAIPESERAKVYYGDGDGLNAMVRGTVHTDVIDIAGGHNIAEIEESMRGGAAIVSLEQLMLWDPDVILFSPESIYDEVASLPEWQGINAVKTGRYYEIPAMPYNWMGRPASVNRILGIKWLSNLLYPDVFGYDMVREVRDFCRLFYHCELTDAQIEALLAKSTFKR